MEQCTFLTFHYLAQSQKFLVTIVECGLIKKEVWNLMSVTMTSCGFLYITQG